MALQVAAPGLITLANEQRPFDRTDPNYANALAQLQGNILKSHGRDFAAHIFFRLNDDLAAARAAFAQLRSDGYVVSAAEQFAQKKADCKPFGSLLFSAKGLQRVALAPPAGFGDPPTPGGAPPAPVDMTFAAPMAAAAKHLNDDPPSWEDPYRSADLDGLLIVAYGNHGPDEAEQRERLRDHVEHAKALLAPCAEYVHVEFGHTHVLDGEPREHFGFVDGISQPLFTTQDLQGVAPGAFDPSDGLAHLVVEDPFANSADAFGSFYVFRKLEQNVAGFREAVAALATNLGIDVELASGFVVGRFRNGDSVELGAAPTGPLPQTPPPNAFDYAGDEQAQKCPFQAHVRKTNPRGDIGRIIGARPGAPPAAALDEAERGVRIARRGITYGDRAPDLSDAPACDVGLLFQCYQANIPQQFAFMQQNWANTNGFVQSAPPAGQDPVIGQGDDAAGTSATSTRADQTWPTAWNASAKKALPDFGSYVTMKGGEFFFAPSIPTIEAFGA